jgi:hypothetical protein
MCCRRHNGRDAGDCSHAGDRDCHPTRRHGCSRSAVALAWLSRACGKDPVVAEALEIVERAEPLGWDDLWKLFEIIREAVKPDTIITLGWTTAADLESFKESANRKDVSGDGARHARRPGQPQHRKMPITEGRSFVSDLLIKWLDSLN